jgi:hypothetical protein
MNWSSLTITVLQKRKTIDVEQAEEIPSKCEKEQEEKVIKSSFLNLPSN